ncbi:MAG TPA: sensor histidine kinase, partial [Solirubrobacteraceae bacterium]
AGRWRLLGVALVAVMAAISQTGGGPYDNAAKVGGLVVVFAINAGAAGAFTWFGWISKEQKQRRVEVISQLTAANGKLEATLRENAALHEQLLEQARSAGISQERQRMSREIHDTIAQGLTGIITQLQAAEQAAGDRVTESRHLTAAIELARESLSEARRSVQAMRPEALETARLPDAVKDVADRWSVLHGVPVAVTTTGAARAMRPEIEVALLRTAQEALANVAKHAGASRVGLTLSYMEDLVTLDVRDDGVGFAPATNGNGGHATHGAGPAGAHQSVAEGGFGLAAMRQRVEGVAGTLEIESEPRSGTAISATVPAIPPAGGS